MPWLVEWRDEWERSARLRIAVALACALAALWLLMAMGDALDERVAERDRLASQVQRLRALAADPRWNGLAKDVRTLDAQWRARLWREPTEGRMQAALQDWLRSQISAAGMVPREVAASVMPLSSSAAPEAPDRPPALPEGVRVVRARVTVEVSPLELHRLLGPLVNPPGLMRIVRLAVSNTERRYAELEVEALFVATDRSADAGAEGKP